jgi:hypothetical protein
MNKHVLLGLLLLVSCDCGTGVVGEGEGEAGEGEGEVGEGEGEAGEGEGEAGEGEGEASEGEGEVGDGEGEAGEGEGEAGEGEGEVGEGEGEGLEPTLAGVFLLGRGSSDQLRQGDVATVQLFGTNLSAVTALTITDVLTSNMVVVADDQLLFTATVPHGAELTRRTVTVTTPNGSDSLVGALAITSIHVASDGDDANAGTANLPFRTFTTAMRSTGNSDIVEIDPGRYDEAIGEVWTTNIPTTTAENLTIHGTAAGVILAGPGAASGLIGLFTSSTVSVQGVVFTGFGQGIVGRGASILSLIDVEVNACSTGMQVDTLNGSGVRALNNDIGIRVVRGTLRDFELRNNGEGLLQNSNSAIDISDGIVSNNIDTGIAVGGGGTFSIDFVDVRDNGRVGVRVDGGSVLFTNNVVEGNDIGLGGLGSTTLTIDACAFINNAVGVNHNDFNTGTGVITMTNSSITGIIGGVGNGNGVVASVNELDIEGTVMSQVFIGVQVGAAARLDLTSGPSGPISFNQITFAAFNDERSAGDTIAFRNNSVCSAAALCGAGEECVDGSCAVVPADAIVDLSGIFVAGLGSGNTPVVTCNLASTPNPLFAGPVFGIAEDNRCVRR